MDFISHHIILLVIISQGGGHTHALTHTVESHYPTPVYLYPRLSRMMS